MYQPSELIKGRPAYGTVEYPTTCLYLGVERTQDRSMAPLTELDRRSPLVKPGQKSGLDLLKLSSNPLLVVVGKHTPIIW